MKTLNPFENDILWRYIVLAAERLGNCVISGYKINLRCNICGDGKSKRKKRGYLVYDKKRNVIYYKCFNEGDCECAGEGNAWSGKKWLRHTAPDIYKAFRSEALVSNKTFEINLTEVSETSAREEEEKNINAFLPIDRCSPEYFSAVKDFCLKRMIPRKYIKTFLVAESGKYNGRLIIPFKDTSGNNYFQARTLFNQTPKYLNFTGNRNHAIFGINEVKSDKPVIVLEGPIDSMFVENSVATLGCSYSESVQEILNNFNSIYLFDNDKAGYSASKRMLEKGRPVFLWKRYLQDNGINENVKDINELVILTRHKARFKFEELEKWFSASRFDEIWLK